jgi:hypothetical protein
MLLDGHTLSGRKWKKLLHALIRRLSTHAGMHHLL